MIDMLEPRIIEFPRIGNSSLGYISVAEKEKLSFLPKRIYWTYFTPQDVERGGHAHYELEQILVAMVGKIIVDVESVHGVKQTFELDKPDIGLFVPKMCWHTMKYSHNAIQMSIASSEYFEPDYIRDYQEFQKKINK